MAPTEGSLWLVHACVIAFCASRLGIIRACLAGYCIDSAQRIAERMTNTMLFSMVLMLLAAIPLDGFKFMADWKVPELNNLKNFMDQKKKFEDKKLCVITGTSSGLGRQTAKHLIRNGGWHVICAVRDTEKMELIAEEEGFDPKLFSIMECDLNSFKSVRDFVSELQDFKSDKPLDRLVCNAAVYQPTLDHAKWSEDGIEQQTQINFLSHFLLGSLLIEDLRKAPKARMITVGSVTGNDNTVGGGGVYPIADLRDLDGLRRGGKNPISMMDGYNFNGAKGYKDSKLAIMMMTNMLHDKYHRGTGIAFSSIYPGCIAESPLFREKRPWFRKYFPVFMKYITGGFVGEEEAGQRLYQVIVDPRCTRSGVYWSWNGGPREGRGADALKNDGNIVGAGGAGGDWDSIFENDQSDKVQDSETAYLLWKYATEVTGAEWTAAKAPVSPCPTLKVISLVTAIADKKEELQRAAASHGKSTGASGASGAGAAGGGGTGAIGTRTRDLLGEDLSPPQAPEDTDRGTAPGVSGDFAF